MAAPESMDFTLQKLNAASGGQRRSLFCLMVPASDAMPNLSNCGIPEKTENTREFRRQETVKHPLLSPAIVFVLFFAFSRIDFAPFNAIISASSFRGGACVMKNTTVRHLHAARLSAISAYFSAVRFFALHFYFIRNTAAPSI